jgi:hypothetical protein
MVWFCACQSGQNPCCSVVTWRCLMCAYLIMRARALSWVTTGRNYPLTLRTEERSRHEPGTNERRGIAMLDPATGPRQHRCAAKRASKASSSSSSSSIAISSHARHCAACGGEASAHRRCLPSQRSRWDRQPVDRAACCDRLAATRLQRPARVRRVFTVPWQRRPSLRSDLPSASTQSQQAP